MQPQYLCKDGIGNNAEIVAASNVIGKLIESLNNF